MSKTAEEIGMIAVGVALMVATYGAGSGAVVTIWGMTFSESTLFAVGLSAGLTGTFGLLQSILNPNDTSVPGSQSNAQESAAYRRVVYGNVEVGGVKTYDSAPAGNQLYQNEGPQANWRHLVFTLTGHQITSFGRGGIMCVIIDNIYTELTNIGNGIWVPSDPLNPWGGNTNDGDENEFPGSYHIAFEFDVGNPASVLIENGIVEGMPFPMLSGACPDWGLSCCQVGRAKVHVALRYDYLADGSQIGNNNLATFQPIFVNGYVPTIRFPITGKPILDTRMLGGGGSPTTWHPDSFYSFANYIIDAANRVEWQTNGPGGSFQSGPGPNPPAFAGPGFPTADNEAEWLDAGPLQSGGWPGPERTILYPYTFTDPNGNLQTLMEPACGGSPLEFDTGPSEPTWATQPGQYTPDGSTMTIVNGLVSTSVQNAGSGGIDGTYTIFVLQPGNPGGYTAVLSVVVSGGRIASCAIVNPGYGYLGIGQSFQVINGASQISPPTGFPNGASILATVNVINLGQQGPTLGVTAISVPTPGSGFSAQPLSFPVYDSSEPNNQAYAATATAYMRLGGGVAAPYNFQIDHVVVNSPGATYTGTSFDIVIPNQIVGGTPATLQCTVGDVSGGSGQNPQVWLCLGVPTAGIAATNPSNPALIIYDYLTNTDYGEGADPSTIDMDSINAMANLCEETVVVTVASNGGTVSENRYNCDGVFDYGTARGDVLKALVASCAGVLVPPGDLWHLFGGVYSPPVVALTDADLRDSIKFDFRISRRDICNGVKGTIMPSFVPTNTTEAQPAPWRWTDFPPYQGNGLQGHPDYLTEDGGQIIWKEVRFGFCTSIWQAQRLAKIVLMLLRFQVSGHLACKLTAFQVQAGDTITFTHARWAALLQPPPITFFVTQATQVIEMKNGAPCIGIDLVLRETDPSIYEFAAPTLYQPPSTPWVEGDGEYSQYGSLGVL